MKGSGYIAIYGVVVYPDGSQSLPRLIKDGLAPQDQFGLVPSPPSWGDVHPAVLPLPDGSYFVESEDGSRLAWLIACHRLGLTKSEQDLAVGGFIEYLESQPPQSSYVSPDVWLAGWVARRRLAG